VDDQGENLDSDGGDFWGHGYLSDTVSINIFFFKGSVILRHQAISGLKHGRMLACQLSCRKEKSFLIHVRKLIRDGCLFFSSTANQRGLIEGQFAQRLANLPPSRRTFTRVDCYQAGMTGNDDIVVALGMAGNSLQLIARSADMIKGWTQAYLQKSILFALDQEPPGGGYRPRGYLPFVAFLTPNGRYPFVVPGDMFDYTEYLAYEIEPAQWIP